MFFLKKPSLVLPVFIGLFYVQTIDCFIKLIREFFLSLKEWHLAFKANSHKTVGLNVVLKTTVANFFRINNIKPGEFDMTCNKSVGACCNIIFLC